MARPALIAVLCCLLCGTVLANSPADHLARSIQFPTISHQQPELIDYDAFRRHQAFLRATYPRVFGQLEIEVIADHSLLLTWPGSDPALAPVLFTAHLDVVPIEPGTEGDWTHPPFAGVIADGRIYGRGALDDKVGVISLLEAAEALLTEGYRPKRTLLLAFGHDEEISGVDGAANIARRLQEKGIHCDWMVDEGGFITSDHPMVPDQPVAMVNVAEKGYVTLTLVATGEGGHSSMPPSTTSIGRLAQALARIEANPMPTRLVSPVTDMLEGLAPWMPFPQDLVFSNLWLTGPLVSWGMGRDRLANAYVRNTTAVTMFNGGVKENVVPQRAEARVNFRLLPGETPEALVAYIRDVIDDDAIVISHEQWTAPPPMAAMQDSGYAVIERAVQEVYPEAVVVPGMIFATTDTRHYAGVVRDIYRFHGAMMSISQAAGVHGTDEWISVDSFNRTVDIARLMLSGAGTGGDGQ